MSESSVKSSEIKEIYVNQGDVAKFLQLRKLSQQTPVTFSSVYWHKLIIVDGIQYDDELVKKTLARNRVLPYKYQVEGNNTVCLVTSTDLLRFVRTHMPNLKLFNDDQMIHLEFVINFQSYTNECSPFTYNKVIDSVLERRYNKKEKVLDLRNFHNDEDLKEVFVPLNVFFTIEVVARAMNSKPCSLVLVDIKTVLLGYNGIDKLDFFDSFRHSNWKKLDLSHNEITWSGFEIMTPVRISELILEHNPLYEDFNNSTHLLFKEVRKVIPTLKKLDGIYIGKISTGDIHTLKLYIKSPSYSMFVDHFLHYYFTLYETDRNRLKHIYHQNSMFSISVKHLEDQFTSSGTSINKYMKYNRNILVMSDLQKMFELAFLNDDIISCFEKLPTLKFDPLSFQVDVPVINNKLIQINVVGLFVDSESFELFSFDRTFILVPFEDDIEEWKIINDMWYISNGTTAMGEKFTPEQPVETIERAQLYINGPTKQQDIDTFAELTELKSAWVQKFLGDSNGNLEMALTCFTDQYKANQVPPEAFK